MKIKADLFKFEFSILRAWETPSNVQQVHLVAQFILGGHKRV